MISSKTKPAPTFQYVLGDDMVLNLCERRFSSSPQRGEATRGKSPWIKAVHLPDRGPRLGGCAPLIRPTTMLRNPTFVGWIRRAARGLGLHMRTGRAASTRTRGGAAGIGGWGAPFDSAHLAGRWSFDDYAFPFGVPRSRGAGGARGGPPEGGTPNAPGSVDALRLSTLVCPAWAKTCSLKGGYRRE